LSTTNPNTLWTPDFFWEAPPDAREHIEYFNALTPLERHRLIWGEVDYIKAVDQTAKMQPPQVIREFAEFVMKKVADEGKLETPLNPEAYASYRRVRNKGQAENGQNLRTITERWLHLPERHGSEFDPSGLVTFEQQQALDEGTVKRLGCAIHNLASVKVYTDSPAIYEWPKTPGLTKDWPFVRLNVRTTGVHLEVTYPDYQRGMPLSLPTTPERIGEMRTYLEQFSPTAAETPADS